MEGLKQDIGAEAKRTSAELRSQADEGLEAIKSQAADMAGAVQDKAETLAGQGKDAGAERAEGLAHAVRRAADDLESSSPEIAKHVRAAADSVEGVADSLRERSVGDLINEMNGFARRQPAAFFGAAMLAGFALSRFAKSSAAPDRDRTGGTAGRTTAGTRPHASAVVPPGSPQGRAPGWTAGSPDAPHGAGRPMTMPAATLGGAAAHQPGTAGPGSMPDVTEVTS